MSNFFGNSQIYNIHSENEVAEILSNFNTEFVRQIIHDQIQQKFNFPNIRDANNMMASLEQNFKYILDCYIEQQESIYDVRSKTYFEIIEVIKNDYNLDLQPGFTSTSGNYTEAYWMYDFFVGNYLKDLVLFFTKVILKDMNSQYDALPPEVRNASSYSEKTYSADPKFGIIMDNLKTVIDNICNYDFSLYDIISAVYGKEIADVICSTVIDKGDFFKNNYVMVHHTFFGPQIFTDIRLALHAEYVSKFGNDRPAIEIN